ncbi:hypothetical protein V5F59_19230 [Xanthobacter autotrophicus DSM 431]|uniref:hypothetical protein n=1 Tax=Xanthobacter nonsaccharivorans TaxID=3119912 RepID=UPI00372B629F
MVRGILSLSLVFLTALPAMAQGVAAGCPDPKLITKCVACSDNRSFVCPGQPVGPRSVTDVTFANDGVMFSVPDKLTDFQVQGVIKDLNKKRSGGVDDPIKRSLDKIFLAPEK